MEEIRTDDMKKMSGGMLQDTGVLQQTWVLLYKNVLTKWRNKTQLLQELVLPLLLLCLISTEIPTYRQYECDKINSTVLGKLDEYNYTGVGIGYTPVDNATKRIMEKVASRSFMNGTSITGYEDESSLQKFLGFRNETLYWKPLPVGIVFKNKTTYHLRLTNMPKAVDHLPVMCYDYYKALYYWEYGFVTLQATIDAAIIEENTNHSVWEELLTMEVAHKESPDIFEERNEMFILMILIIIIYYLPFVYSLSSILVAEKKRLKDLVVAVDLKSSALWLSWGILYGGFMFIMSVLISVFMTVFATSAPNRMWFPLFLMFFLHGLSQMFFTFMLSSLFKKTKIARMNGALTVAIFGILGLSFMDTVPTAVGWMLCLVFPWTFCIGFSQIILLEETLLGATFSNLTVGPYPLVAVYIVYIVDCIIYLMLALFFDHIESGEHGLFLSIFYFIRDSCYRKPKQRALSTCESIRSYGPLLSDKIEPVPSELSGKEVIRMNNIKKTYRVKNNDVKALRGLSFDVYEGQIMALLGHSGSGKTTLMNILSGTCKPSEGSAIIYGLSTDNRADLKKLRTMLGVCPQMDFNFGALTVEENLKVFAAIKGIKRKEIDNEVQKILKTLNIENISKSYANSLSGGQKRKLSLAIAILGDPQILLLDDPTAGMDPCSRHYVWSFLKGRKPDQVTVISTQFMDEADILADQKAVISHGTLKCLGSSLFLKSKWGIGYKLSMYVNESCDVDKVTSLIKLHIPKAELEQRHEAEVIYSLPFENISIFPGLFSSIDASTDLGIVNYGVSITTLESVFLRLEGESDIEQADYSVFNQEQLEEEKHGGCQDDLQEGLLSFSESNISAVTGMALWRQQVCAIAKLHWLNLKHERKKLRNVLALILIPLFSTITYVITRDTSTSMQLSPGLVLLQNGVMPKQYHTKLLLQNSTDSSIDDILNILDNQGISTELFTGDDILSAIPHNAALNIMANKTSRFQAVFSRNVIHSLPVLISIVSNLLCIKLNCSDTIHTWSEPFERYRETQEQFVILQLTSVILFGIAPQFTMDNIRDRKVAAHSQMFISGLFPSAYWCGQSLMDIPLYFGLTTFTTGIILSTFYPVTYSFGSICMLIIFLFTQSTAIVFLCYLLSCQLNKSRDFWSFIFILFSGVPSFIEYPLYYDVSHLLVPTVSAYIHFVDSWHWAHIYPEMSYGRWRDIGSLIYFIISIVFLLILNCIERRCGKQVMTTDPIFRISPRKRKAISNTAELDDEDEDVQEERIKATSDLTSQDHEERPNIAVQNLRKEYIERKLCCVKGKKKTAVKNVSFCVNKGEVLGLLGPNGAGKTTTMFMITGETVPSAGKVVMNDELLRYIGYCPQINPLWPFHTVKEHLEIYAAIKGLRKEDAMETIKRVGNTLELKEHFQSPTNKLSAGIKRKLSFALSMLGDPHVMLLDEPSTSMDPKGKQRVWRSIRAALMNKQRAAVLTTHCMEEAEAVCDRVAIVVSGKLRCIGSIQHLKSKYGKGYVLEIKLKEVVAEEQKDLYNAVLQMFPHAEHQERLASHMLFKIPMEDVKSLAQSFSMLEEAKQQFDIKEYSFSQATLEQTIHFFVARLFKLWDDHSISSMTDSIFFFWINSTASCKESKIFTHSDKVFIECVKEQEQDNAGMALNTNFQWKRFE